MTTAILLVTVLPWPGAKLNSNSNKKNSLLLPIYTFGHAYNQFASTMPYTSNTHLPSYHQHFQEPHWKSMGLPEISRATQHARSWTYTGYQRVNTIHINLMHVQLNFPVLTYWGLVTHVCADELGLHWLRQWLVALLVPSHHLYQGRHLPTKWSCSCLNVLTIKSHGDFIQINRYPAW